MQTDVEKPSPADLKALRELISAHGEAGAGRILGIHREPVARMLAELEVRSGTVYLLRARLAEARAARGADPRADPMSSGRATLQAASATDPTEQQRAPNEASPAGHQRPQLSEPVVPSKKHQATEQPRLQVAASAVLGGSRVPVAISLPATLDSTPPMRAVARARGAR